MATRLSKITPDGPGLSRVPPHNLEAEESVLGACLLSRQAIATALETVAAEDFYKPAHAEMFKIMLDLYARGEPVDAVTLGEELRRGGRLDEFGGKPYLFTLVNSVPTPGSVGHYARIVQENATLRRLIDASQQISDLAYALPDDVEEAVDQSEDLIYQVTNRRVSEDLAHLKDLLTENMEMVEKLYERGSAITGVATGFSDLDDLTAGLQPSNLIIVAARPSMGKALALDTPIATPAGWTTMGEIEVGDEVFDDRGRVCSVDHVSPVYTDHDCYEVTFDDGGVIVADGGHEWPVVVCGEPGVLTTSDMAASARSSAAAGSAGLPWQVPLAEALELPEAPLPVDPYVLGCWLGGEHTAKTRMAIAKADRSHFSWEFQRAGYRVDKPVALPRKARQRIPAQYLRASFKQRLALLQGIMDTAGRVRHDPGGTVELCLLNRDVLGQARELVCSLGHRPGPVRKCTVALKGGGTAKGRRFSWTPLDPVFRLARKADRLARDMAKANARSDSPRVPETRSVVSVVAVASVAVRCIQVGSPSHLYLAGRSLIPTHNSALALSIAQHVAATDHRPVVIFSLEMSKMELVQRLMCSEARVDSNRLRRGALQDSDWPKLSLALGRLAEAPIFIDDTPNATIMEMRAKCRRVASKSGLGLVIIDYLQLMAPLRRTDNRVQEVSEISRSLKILARELDVPVIALSQLSRNVEYRADKRPLLADLRESGCVTAGTRILRADTGAEVTIGELLASGERPLVWSLDPHLRMVPRPVENVFPSGVKEVFRVRLASGRTVEASANHPFLTIDGWMPLGELTKGTRVGAPRTVPEPVETRPVPEAEIILLAHLIGDGSFVRRQPIRYATKDEANVAAVTDAARHFGVTAIRDDYPAARCVTLRLPAPHRLTHGKRNPIAAWLDGLGLFGLRSYEKFVPAPVFSLPNEQVALFLRHLWATDGCVWWDKTAGMGRVYYASTSRRLTEDVARLLLRFGILSRSKRTSKAGYRDCWQLTINGAEGQLRFIDTIGVHGVRGEACIEMATKLRNIKVNTNLDTVPREIWDRIRDSAALEAMTDRDLSLAMNSRTRRKTMGKHAPSRGRLAKFAEILGDPSLEMLATSDVFWDEVLEITPLGPEPVFDATVSDNHNFVAEGIILHNSIEQDADVVMFIYRDEVYHPDSPQRGIAEIHISKHRSGPIGKVELTFLEHYTKFANLARGM
jgi:replicative DNA helicase